MHQEILQLLNHSPFSIQVNSPMSTITAESPWKTTTEVTAYLKVARQTLNRNMDRLSYGHHYFRKDPGNKKSQLIWHLKNLEKYFCTPVRMYKN